MSLFSGPEEHAVNPPSSWQVGRAGPRRWYVRTATGAVLHSTETRTAAKQARESGFYARLYEQETRWYAGEDIPDWRSWAEVRAENERNAARWAKKEG